jgi:hypothetical protein
MNKLTNARRDIAQVKKILKATLGKKLLSRALVFRRNLSFESLF